MRRRRLVAPSAIRSQRGNKSYNVTAGESFSSFCWYLIKVWQSVKRLLPCNSKLSRHWWIRCKPRTHFGPQIQSWLSTNVKFCLCRYMLSPMQLQTEVTLIDFCKPWTSFGRQIQLKLQSGSVANLDQLWASNPIATFSKCKTLLHFLKVIESNLKDQCVLDPTMCKHMIFLVPCLYIVT